MPFANEYVSINFTVIVHFKSKHFFIEVMENKFPFYWKGLELTKEDIIFYGFQVQRFQIASNFHLSCFICYCNDTLRVFNF